MTRFQQWLITSALTLALLAPTAAAIAQEGENGATSAAPGAQINAVGAAQISLLEQEKAARTPVQQKMSSALLMALRHWRQDPLFNALPDFQTLAPDADGRMLVDIDLLKAAGLKPVLAVLAEMNTEIVYQSAAQRTVRALMPLDQTETLAAMPEVKGIRDADQAIVNRNAAPRNVAAAWAGAWAPLAINVSEGDVTHQASLARQTYAVSGAGQKICALSDGVNSLATAQASGDLPSNVAVLPGQAGGGHEGTAMLEIIHDLAPGAQLGFATGFNGVAGFAQNIRNLQAAGCTIIVDDISYFVESPFQDNDIAQAVIDVTAAGAQYLSSAANDGNLTNSQSGTWEGDFKPNGTIGALPAGVVHDFGNGGQSNALTSSANNVTMHWVDPFDASGNDYDLYVMNSTLTSVLAASTNLQNGSGRPFEMAQGSFLAGARVVVLRKSGAANRMINVIAWRSTLQLATSGATRGHSAAPLAFSVAAVPAAAPFAGGGPTGPYPNPFTTADQVEWFSSDGPRRIFFDFNGALLPGAPAGNFSATGGVVRQKPDIAAADGVQTSAPGFDPFFGTSAAAPHAAAIVGLLQEAFPLSSTLEIRTLLQVSALDIMAPGVDRDAGYGLVMPLAALQAGGAQSRADLLRAGQSAAELLGNGDAVIDPAESWQLTIPISNTGAVAATAVSATLLTSAPGVEILTGASSYPDLAVGEAGANVTPFVFRLAPDFVCGAPLAFTLLVQFQDTAARTAPLAVTLPTGALSSTPQIFSYTGPARPIPDDPTPPVAAVAPLTVTGVSGRIGRLLFRIDGTLCTTTAGATTVGVNHTYVSDLSFDLVAPSGVQATLIDHAGEYGDNFCQTELDDLAATSIQAATASDAPFTGQYRPNTTLANFNTLDANGTWQLRVTDTVAGDDGNLRAFSLHIWPVACRAAALLTNLTITPGTLTPAFAPTTTRYTAQVPTTATTLTMTPTAGAGVTISTNGAPASSPLTLALVAGQHASATLTLQATGSSAVVTYTVLANRPPQLIDGAWTTQQGTPIRLDVLEGASDLDGDSLTLAAVTPTATTFGVLSGISASGQITYTPNAGFFGLADFGFTVEDGSGGSANGVASVLVQPTNTLFLPLLERAAP
jgi:subtilisin-like proprotein convertase family protein